MNIDGKIFNKIDVQNSAPIFMIKKKKNPLQKQGTEGTYLNLTKTKYNKSTAASYSVVDSWKHFSNIRSKTKMSAVTTVTQHSFSNLNYSNQRRKRSKGNLNWKRKS